MVDCEKILALVLTIIIVSIKMAMSKQPHIVFIVADDLGWNDVGWRNPQMYTPNLNKLALQGVILNSSYVQPVCSPSRGSFMSGYYPFHIGLQHSGIKRTAKQFMPSNVTTLAEHLKALGYHTHMVGKWHLGFCNWKYTPTYRGFDSFVGYYNGAQDYYNHTEEYNRRIDGFDFRFNESVYRASKKAYSASVFANRAIDIISNTNPTSKPLFLYLAFQSVHEPLEVPEKYERYYKHIKDQRRRVYCGMVSALDEAVGNVTSALEKHGFMDNLLMVFTTDNGGPTYAGANNWPLRGAKTTLWEGGTKGTAFVYSRTLLRKTRYINTELIHAADWLPTFVTIAGGRPDRNIDGVNQWKTISEGALSSRTEFVYNIDQYLNNGALRVGKYKILKGSAGKYNGWYPLPTVSSNITLDIDCNEEEQSDCKETVSQDGRPSYRLFNIESDPAERFDILKEHQYIAKNMINKLDNYQKSVVPSPKAVPDPHSNPELYGGNWSPGWC